MDFETALAGFLTVAQSKVDQSYGESSNRHTIEVERGIRYIRVIRAEYGKDNKRIGRSAYCFVDTTNGNVLKSGGWKGPAKGARSNIYAPDFGASGITAYGAVYHYR